MANSNNFVLYKDNGVLGRITSIEALGRALRTASFTTWIQGLGEPTCQSDINTWNRVGEMIRKFTLKEEDL